MQRKVALVTMLIGESYQDYWKAYCQPTWKGYADRHGLDLIPLTEPIDNSPRALARSPAWQKCLILSQPFSADYDQIVWVDADIIINFDEAPLLTERVPLGKIGGVISGSHILDDLKPVLLSRLRGKRYDYQHGRQHWWRTRTSFICITALTLSRMGSFRQVSWWPVPCFIANCSNGFTQTSTRRDSML